MTLSNRFSTLDNLRTSKVERCRYFSSLTVPSLLPPDSWTEQQPLSQPYSSVAAKGVTAMASRMLSALLPLNDMPFFKFELSSGVEPDAEIYSYLEALSYQVFNKLSSANLRETIYQILQHLIVVGDVMIIMDDDFDFRVIRLDRFVCRRDVHGKVQEVIFIEYDAIDSEKNDSDTATSYAMSQDEKRGYKKIFVQALLEKDETWSISKEDRDGNSVDKGVFKVLPYIILRWSAIPSENYGRSHVEDMIGDIKALEAFTEGLINGVAASSLFWMGVDPAGMTDIEDLAASPTGNFVPARMNEVFAISPATTMTPQIQSTQAGVDILRREIGKAFLMDSSSIPSGDRVTATAVRMIGQELEHVLGGAFSSIARDLMQPIVKRCVFLMMNQGDIDERLNEMFDQEGVLNIEIVTGLQALSRDTDLQKLMQMGEMVRNLPEQAAAMFKWDQFGKALITSLGFAPDAWIKSEEELQQEQMAMQQQQMAMQAQQQAEMGGQQAVTNVAEQMAMEQMSATQEGGMQ
jgi:hypothetical protein